MARPARSPPTRILELFNITTTTNHTTATNNNISTTTNTTAAANTTTNTTSSATTTTTNTTTESTATPTTATTTTTTTSSSSATRATATTNTTTSTKATTTTATTTNTTTTITAATTTTTTTANTTTTSDTTTTNTTTTTAITTTATTATYTRYTTTTTTTSATNTTTTATTTTNTTTNMTPTTTTTNYTTTNATITTAIIAISELLGQFRAQFVRWWGKTVPLWLLVFSLSLSWYLMLFNLVADDFATANPTRSIHACRQRWLCDTPTPLMRELLSLFSLYWCLYYTRILHDFSILSWVLPSYYFHAATTWRHIFLHFGWTNCFVLVLIILILILIFLISPNLVAYSRATTILMHESLFASLLRGCNNPMLVSPVHAEYVYLRTHYPLAEFSVFPRALGLTAVHLTAQAIRRHVLYLFRLGMDLIVFSALDGCTMCSYMLSMGLLNVDGCYHHSDRATFSLHIRETNTASGFNSLDYLSSKSAVPSVGQSAIAAQQAPYFNTLFRPHLLCDAALPLMLSQLSIRARYTQPRC